MDTKDWNVANAKQSLSKVIEDAKGAPQRIYKRDRLVAAMIGAEDLAEFERWRAGQARRSFGAAFAELREIATEEGYRLDTGRRGNRRNAFADGIRRVSR
jgi:hypothetical protein